MSNPSEPWIPADQQPIRRVVGKRVAAPPGRLPTAAVRSAMDANGQYRTRAPKGLFFYQNHDQMIRDREQWTVDAIVQKQSERA